MSGPEQSLHGFFRRWSRRKLAAEDHVAEKPHAHPDSAERTESVSSIETLLNAPAGAVDPTRLPPIDSIEAASDIRAFLAPGVPLELTRAALRRAWVSDPAIRDFIGLAENQWDFTKPDTVPGFGSLKLTTELGRMVAELFGESGVADARATEQMADASQKPLPSDPVDSAQGSLAVSPSFGPASAKTLPQTAEPNVALQDSFAVEATAPVKPRRGRALPK